MRKIMLELLVQTVVSRTATWDWEAIRNALGHAGATEKEIAELVNHR